MPWCFPRKKSCTSCKAKHIQSCTYTLMLSSEDESSKSSKSSMSSGSEIRKFWNRWCLIGRERQRNMHSSWQT
jgi:hypothetical protein